ncbi:LacI family DNA-binding transcriptional regulator [Antarctobacter heliothermus]|uniref:LacI family transcriptional regulator n=1 Tax=Antarctobacter heliothermus TaxID=74033 RepID=A0A239L032_9RHOB|nr:LacI family DNA-binding transcriptional regulator [Antarctobacter heliothermus]SNT23342.1 LacI family transcriptional regulator [Antarctobacter heliothermus]
MRQPNTTEIARALGLSRATVSNVINGKGRVSKGTRDRVEAALKEAGYVRDLGAVALKTGKSRLVGVIVTDIANPFYAAVVSSIESHLSEAGFTTVLGQTKDDLDRQMQLLKECVGTGIAGLIVNPCAGTTLDDLKIAAIRDVPVVLFVRDLAGSGLELVAIDDKHGSEMLGVHMVAQGYRNFAVLGGFPSTTTFQGRSAGVIETLRTAGLPAPRVCPGPITEEFGYAETLRLYPRFPELDAIAAHNDFVALGALRALRELGVSVGSDVGIGGFDNLNFSQLCDPPLTTVNVCLSSIGAEAGRRLLARIRKPDTPCGVIRMQPELIVRASTRRGK